MSEQEQEKLMKENEELKAIVKAMRTNNEEVSMNGKLYRLLMNQLESLDEKKIEDIEVRHISEGGDTDRLTVDIFYVK